MRKIENTYEYAKRKAEIFSKILLEINNLETQEKKDQRGQDGRK